MPVKACELLVPTCTYPHSSRARPLSHGLPSSESRGTTFAEIGSSSGGGARYTSAGGKGKEDGIGRDARSVSAQYWDVERRGGDGEEASQKAGKKEDGASAKAPRHLATGVAWSEELEETVGEEKYELTAERLAALPVCCYCCCCCCCCYDYYYRVVAAATPAKGPVPIVGASVASTARTAATAATIACSLPLQSPSTWLSCGSCCVLCWWMYRDLNVHDLCARVHVFRRAGESILRPVLSMSEASL